MGLVMLGEQDGAILAQPGKFVANGSAQIQLFASYAGNTRGKVNQPPGATARYDSSIRPNLVIGLS